MMLQSRDMKEGLRAVWRWVKWPLCIIAGLLVAFVVYRLPVVMDKQKTDEAVAQIHAAKITLADVTGDTMIQVPDKAENDATVAGLDSNNNGIRDDVELAIFRKYLNDKKSRAAALQYAMSEQMYLTRVYNTETWKAVAEEDARAGLCLLNSEADWKELQDLVSNTQLRKDARVKAFEFITSHGSAEGAVCDISLD